MIETEQQRRWWFATHPEYSRKNTQSDDEDDESGRPSPESVDAWTDRRLKNERNNVLVAMYKSLKYWFGTEFQSKSAAEKHALLWGDQGDDSSDEARGEITLIKSPLPIDSEQEARAQEQYEKAIAQDKKGLEADPHTALDLMPYRRLLTSPVRFVKDYIRNSARDVILSAKKKDRAGWKVGDHPLTPTSKGVEPSWTTQARRHWKNEAAAEGAADKWGAENVERMKKGLAPQRINRKTGEPESKELHHSPTPRRDYGKEFIDVWPDEHAELDLYRRLKKQ